VTVRIRYCILNTRLAAGAVSAGQGGGVDQAYDGWWVVSQFGFQQPGEAGDVGFTPALGALGQARDGGDQDRAEHKAHNAHRGKDKTLPAGQAFAFGIVEEVGEFLVDFDHWQEPGEAGAEAPNGPMLLRCWQGHPEERRPTREMPKNQ
jgi:hypothetical protein